MKLLSVRVFSIAGAWLFRSNSPLFDALFRIRVFPDASVPIRKPENAVRFAAPFSNRFPSPSISNPWSFVRSH